MEPHTAVLVPTAVAAAQRILPEGFKAYAMHGAVMGARFDDLWIDIDILWSDFRSETLRDKFAAYLNESWRCRATPESQGRIDAEIDRYLEKLARLYS